MSEIDKDHLSSTEGVESASFSEIKETASKNISQMLQDLQAFEIAIKFEQIPDIYRIYNGQLHEELKKTSNANHEIDNLLAQKIHDSFMAAFPFMVHTQKVSETMNHYKIGQYYRERATIGIDSSIPQIFVIPEIDQEWGAFNNGDIPSVGTIEEQMNQLEAKAITAKTEISKLDDQIRDLKQQEASIANSKGFFNRGKVDEEIQELTAKREALESKREEWLPYVDQPQHTSQQREALEKQYKQTRLNRAIVAKEFRQITKYFGGIEAMQQELTDFLTTYLEPKPINREGV